MINNKKGFTLAELLIVVAIIAVLVGISIPVFTSQLEKSREAKDLANVRSAYAELMTDALNKKEGSSFFSATDNSYSVKVSLSQAQDDWQGSASLNIAGIDSDDEDHWLGSPKANGQCEIKYNASTSETFFIWSGELNLDSNPDLLFDADTYPDETFKMEIGKIYTYQGKQYVCNADVYCEVYDNDGNKSGTPDRLYGYFIPVNKDAGILTVDDVNSNSNSLDHVAVGSVFKDGDDYYILSSLFDLDDVKVPSEAPDYVWSKIIF